MERKLKLANLIIFESESLKTASSLECSLALAEELTKDSIELAKLVQSEAKPKAKSKNSKQFNEITSLIAEGFLEFPKGSKMQKHILAATNFCKDHPEVSITDQIAYECRDEIEALVQVQREFGT